MNKFLLIMALCITPLTFADTIKGTLTFKKSAPFAGMFYVKGNSDVLTNEVIDQQDKEFSKKLFVTSPNSDIKFLNSDTMDHNIYANNTDKGINFDAGLVATGGSGALNADWNVDTIVRIGCKIHPKMRGYIANTASNNYQVIELAKKTKEYSLELNNVKPDETLALLLAGYDALSITLEMGETKEVELVRKGKVKGKVTLTRGE